MSDMYQPPQAPVVEDKASGLAKGALICGILGFCCCGAIAGIPALIMGFIENGKINRGESSPKGKGFAIAGMVLGIISILMACVTLIIYMIYGAAAFTGAFNQLR